MHENEVVEPQAQETPNLAEALQAMRDTMNSLRAETDRLRAEIAERDKAINTLLNHPSGKETYDPEAERDKFYKSLKL